MFRASQESPLALMGQPGFGDPWQWCLKPGESTSARALRLLFQRNRGELLRTEVDLPEELPSS